MKTRIRLIRALVGPLSGAAIAAVLTGVLFFISVYTEPDQQSYGSDLGWAVQLGFAGMAMGYVGGFLLGIFLALTQRGPIFGAVSGAVAGAALIAVGLAFGETPKDAREMIIDGGVMPVTVLSGLSISLILSAITSLTKRTDDGHELSLDQILSSLKQDKSNETCV